MPIAFDICALKVDGKEKTYRGWWTGNGWDGLRLQEGEKVLYWKNIVKEVMQY
jgi:hypothetical protein